MPPNRDKTVKNSRTFTIYRNRPERTQKPLFRLTTLAFADRRFKNIQSEIHTGLGAAGRFHPEFFTQLKNW